MKKCTKCLQLKDESEFHKRTASRDGLNPKCRDCQHEYDINNRGHYKARRTKVNRADLLWRWYGLTLDDFNALLESQNNSCAICGTVDPGNRSWVVDHNHSCCPGNKSCGDCVRGILCASCNNGLGFFKDDIVSLNKAIDYLK